MPQYIENSFNNIPAVKFIFLESAEINKPIYHYKNDSFYKFIGYLG